MERQHLGKILFRCKEAKNTTRRGKYLWKKIRSLFRKKIPKKNPKSCTPFEEVINPSGKLDSRYFVNDKHKKEFIYFFISEMNGGTYVKSNLLSGGSSHTFFVNGGVVDGHTTEDGEGLRKKNMKIRGVDRSKISVRDF